MPDHAPITRRSAVLFRFGEQCDNHCPMCSNTGLAHLRQHSTEELLRRLEFVHGSGFTRAVVTGGEPTIHPGFWTITERVAALGMTFDANTHGRTFSRPGFARRAAQLGLERAIVSLHSFTPERSAEIFGADITAHRETLTGIDRLLEAGVVVMLNCVLSRVNLGEILDYLRTGSTLYGHRVAFKFVFPSTLGKGGRWAPIADLRYSDVQPIVSQLRALADERGARVLFESMPNCIVGDAGNRNVGRSTFGETHYLDDASGDRIYSMRHIEASLAAYGPQCAACSALRGCAGIPATYARRYGVDELAPLRAAPSTTCEAQR